jgi:hypothetical protein
VVSVNYAGRVRAPSIGRLEEECHDGESTLHLSQPTSDAEERQAARRGRGGTRRDLDADTSPSASGSFEDEGLVSLVGRWA